MVDKRNPDQRVTPEQEREALKQLQVLVERQSHSYGVGSIEVVREPLEPPDCGLCGQPMSLQADAPVGITTMSWQCLNMRCQQGVTSPSAALGQGAPEPKPLRALVESWRTEADELDEATRGQFVEPSIKRACADELAAALAVLGREGAEPIQLNALCAQCGLWRQAGEPLADAATETPQPTWQPIETAPKDGRYLLLIERPWHGGEGPSSITMGKWTNSVRPLQDDAGWVRYGVGNIAAERLTHWMNLAVVPSVALAGHAADAGKGEQP